MYPDRKSIAQRNITLDRISIENEIENLLHSNYPSENIRLADTNLNDSRIYFRAADIEWLHYPTVEIALKNVVRKEDSIISDEKHSVNIIEIHSSVTKA